MNRFFSVRISSNRDEPEYWFKKFDEAVAFAKFFNVPDNIQVEYY